MRILLGIWLRRSAFDRLQAWRKNRAAARVVSRGLASALLRGAWAHTAVALSLQNINRRLLVYYLPPGRCSGLVW